MNISVFPISAPKNRPFLASLASGPHPLLSSSRLAVAAWLALFLLAAHFDAVDEALISSVFQEAQP